MSLLAYMRIFAAFETHAEHMLGKHKIPKLEN